MFKTIATWAGRALALAALVFLALAARRNWAALGAWHPSVEALAIIAGAGVAYGVALLLVAESWHQLVSSRNAGLPRTVTLPSYGVTQVAKYLPGNVFHYFGRHMWLARLGIAHQQLAGAVLCETILLATAALTCATGIALIAPPGAHLVLGWDVRDALPLALFAIFALVGLLAALPRLGARLKKLTLPRPASLLRAGAVLLLFFLIQGSLFSFLFVAVGRAPMLEAIGIASISWLIGFLTPGAPGGVGSRELVLLALVGPLLGTGNALIVAALFRIVTVAGDCVCLGLSLLIARWAPSPQTEAAPI